jgi:hypothetical protein
VFHVFLTGDYRLLKIIEINDFQGLEQIKTEWIDLLGHSRSNNIFLSYEWITSCINNFHKGNRLFILCAYVDSRLVGIAPLVMTRGRFTKLPVRKIESIGSAWGYGGFIIDESSINVDDCMEAFLKYLLINGKKSDVYLLAKIPVGSGHTDTIKSILRKKNASFLEDSLQIPYISLEESFDAFVSNRSYSFRRNIKNRERRLKNFGCVTLKRFNKDFDYRNIMDIVFDISQRSWKEKNHTSISSNPDVKNFYLDIAEKFYGKGCLEISIMYIDDKPVSYMFGAKYNEDYIDIDIAYDEEYASASPGNIHRYYLLKELFNERLRTFDFVANFDYKNELTDKYMEHVSFPIFNRKIYSRILFYARRHMLQNR